MNSASLKFMRPTVLSLTRAAISVRLPGALLLRTVAVTTLLGLTSGACRHRAPTPANDGSTDGGESLDTLRVEVPCTGDSTASYFCSSDSAQIHDATTLPGPTDTINTYTVRVRGVAEFKFYPESTEGENYCTGGRPDSYGSNSYQLIIEGGSTYNLNCASTLTNADNHACYPWDFNISFQAKGGTTITLLANPVDTVIDRNRSSSGEPVVVSGVAPAPAAFDGQFFQVDILAL